MGHSSSVAAKGLQLTPPPSSSGAGLGVGVGGYEVDVLVGVYVAVDVGEGVRENPTRDGAIVNGASTAKGTK